MERKDIVKNQENETDSISCYKFVYTFRAHSNVRLYRFRDLFWTPCLNMLAVVFTLSCVFHFLLPKCRFGVYFGDLFCTPFSLPCLYFFDIEPQERPNGAPRCPNEAPLWRSRALLWATLEEQVPNKLIFTTMPRNIIIY